MRTILFGLISMIFLLAANPSTAANETGSARKYVNTKFGELRSGINKDRILFYLPINEEVVLLNHDSDSDFCKVKARKVIGYMRCDEISDAPDRLSYLFIHGHDDYQSALEYFNLRPSVENYWTLIAYFKIRQDEKAKHYKRYEPDFQDIVRINNDSKNGKLVGKKIPELASYKDGVFAIDRIKKEGGRDYFGAMLYYYTINGSAGYNNLFDSEIARLYTKIKLPEIKNSYFNSTSDFAGPFYKTDDVSAIFNIPFHVDLVPRSPSSSADGENKLLSDVNNLRGLVAYLERPVLHHTIYRTGKIETEPSVVTWAPSCDRYVFNSDNDNYWCPGEEESKEEDAGEAERDESDGGLLSFYTNTPIDGNSVRLSTHETRYLKPIIHDNNYTLMTNIDLNDDGIPDLLFWELGIYRDGHAKLGSDCLIFVNVKGEWYFLD